MLDPAISGYVYTSPLSPPPVTMFAFITPHTPQPRTPNSGTPQSRDTKLDFLSTSKDTGVNPAEQYLKLWNSIF